MAKRGIAVEDMYVFKVGAMWRHFVSDHFSFWMICLYLFFEYFRPQAIYPAIDVLPWAQIFIISAGVGAVLDRSVRWVSSPLNMPLIIFAILIYLSSLFAYYPDLSREHFIDFYGWFVVYFLILNIVNNRERFYILFLILLLCAGKIALGTTLTWMARGFSFTGWGLMGPRGYFQNSGELSILMLTLFPLAFLLFVSSWRKEGVRWWERVAMIVLSVAPLMTILGASSRGGQLALVVMLLIMFRRSIFRPKAFIGIVLFVFVALALLPEEQKARFERTGNDRTSQQRIFYLENGWEMMKKFPMLGVGYFNFSRYFSDYYPEDIITVHENAELPHNILIQVGTDVGFTGLAVFVWLIFKGLRMAFRFPRRPPGDVPEALSRGFGYGIIGFVVAGQFVTVTYYPFLWIGLAFIAALYNITSRSTSESWAARPVFPVDQRASG